jgi:hypothetical protein
MTSNKPEVPDRGSGEEVEATIGSVRVESGYAVAHLRAPFRSLTPETAITFSFSRWGGKSSPLKGQVVVLENIQLFTGGWRAERARPVTP